MDCSIEMDLFSRPILYAPCETIPSHVCQEQSAVCKHTNANMHVSLEQSRTGMHIPFLNQLKPAFSTFAWQPVLMLWCTNVLIQFFSANIEKQLVSFLFAFATQN